MDDKERIDALKMAAGLPIEEERVVDAETGTVFTRMVRRIRDVFLRTKKLVKGEGFRMSAEWHIVARKVDTGEVVYETTANNVIVDDGRVNTLKQILGLATTVTFIALGVGSSNTAADATQTRLQNELIANAARKSLTNTVGAALSAADVTAEVSGAYRQKIIVQAVYAAGDLNNGSTFAEYALFSTATNPATGTSTSGTMLNRFVPASSLAKDGSLAVTVQCTLRA